MKIGKEDIKTNISKNFQKTYKTTILKQGKEKIPYKAQ